MTNDEIIVLQRLLDLVHIMLYTYRNDNNNIMASMKGSSSEIVAELLKLIGKPSNRRDARDIDLTLPWLCKRSQLLQHQSKSKSF